MECDCNNEFGINGFFCFDFGVLFWVLEGVVYLNLLYVEGVILWIILKVFFVIEGV